MSPRSKAAIDALMQASAQSIAQWVWGPLPHGMQPPQFYGRRPAPPRRPPPPVSAPQALSVAAAFAVLELDAASADERTVRRAFRRRALLTHPDRGGSAEAFIATREAYGRALAHVKARPT